MIGKHYETKHIVPTRRADGSLSRVNYGFEEVNVEIPRTLARLAREAGVKSFIHVSALSASPTSLSEWSRSKARGELAVREEFPDAIIVRPATVFGPEDRFLNWIAEACDRLPYFPIVNGGSSLVQPVFCNDIGHGLMEIINNKEQFAGATFQLTGPEEYTYKEVVELVTDVTGKKTPMLEVPLPLAKLAGQFFEQTISPFVTPDMVDQMREDVVAIKPMGNEAPLLTLADLGIDASSMDKTAFDFLHCFRPGGHFMVVEGYTGAKK